MNEKLIRSIKERPVEYARLLGFNLLTEIHNDWMRLMLLHPDDYMKAVKKIFPKLFFHENF